MDMAMIQKNLYTDHGSMLQPQFIHYPRPRLVRLLLHDTRFVRKCFNFTHLAGWFRHGSHDHLEVDRSSVIWMPGCADTLLELSGLLWTENCQRVVPALWSATTVEKVVTDATQSQLFSRLSYLLCSGLVDVMYW